MTWLEHTGDFDQLFVKRTNLHVIASHSVHVLRCVNRRSHYIAIIALKRDGIEVSIFIEWLLV